MSWYILHGAEYNREQWKIIYLLNNIRMHPL